MSPDQTKRQVLKSITDLDRKRLVNMYWGTIERKMERAVGYKRRRGRSPEADLHVSWLFRRHVHRDNFDEIALDSGVNPSTVESAVKKLRRRLDLQLKSAVRHPGHRERTALLYSR